MTRSQETIADAVISVPATCFKGDDDGRPVLGNGARLDELTSKNTSAGDRTLAGLKLLGKSVFNVGSFVVTEAIPSMVQTAGRQAEKTLNEHRSEMSAEQVATMEKTVETGRMMTERRYEQSSVDLKVERLEEQMNSLPKGHPNRELLKKDIADLKKKRPSTYGK